MNVPLTNERIDEIIYFGIDPPEWLYADVEEIHSMAVEIRDLRQRFRNLQTLYENLLRHNGERLPDEERESLEYCQREEGDREAVWRRHGD